MPEVFCDTSPLQYLHQLGQLELLPTLLQSVVIPTAVEEELRAGRERGIDLPDTGKLPWVEIRDPKGVTALPLVRDLGQGETGVLALALESSDTLAILDDRLARKVAVSMGIPIRGTLGLLLDARSRGLVSSVSPLLDELARLGFRIASHTRIEILRRAGESGV